jgi:hypothetical protein
VVIKPDANQKDLVKTLPEWWPWTKVTKRELSVLLVYLLISVLPSTMILLHLTCSFPFSFIVVLDGVHRDIYKGTCSVLNISYVKKIRISSRKVNKDFISRCAVGNC